ncbi:hypothetical protein B0T11DRAFT_81983 [Plectosphaerella cucumerina]|uniref:Uncharacterized protein n=1 Tax=Plectosphaerella cucumerina TaxID=40658 RepID=A0A8K0X324_9PEZI|nr:hypothetical protein B0T11DRAFT_81983 [Plectosphaerella cucumerina]
MHGHLQGVKNACHPPRARLHALLGLGHLSPACQLPALLLLLPLPSQALYLIIHRSLVTWRPQAGVSAASCLVTSITSSSAASSRPPLACISSYRPTARPPVRWSAQPAPDQPRSPAVEMPMATSAPPRLPAAHWRAEEEWLRLSTAPGLVRSGAPSIGVPCRRRSDAHLLSGGDGSGYT